MVVSVCGMRFWKFSVCGIWIENVLRSIVNENPIETDLICENEQNN